MVDKIAIKMTMDEWLALSMRETANTSWRKRYRSAAGKLRRLLDEALTLTDRSCRKRTPRKEADNG